MSPATIDVERRGPGGQAEVEVGLDEPVEPLADALVLDEVDAVDAVTLLADERAELAVGAADVEHVVPGASRAVHASSRPWEECGDGLSS